VCLDDPSAFLNSFHFLIRLRGSRRYVEFSVLVRHWHTRAIRHKASTLRLLIRVHGWSATISWMAVWKLLLLSKQDCSLPCRRQQETHLRLAKLSYSRMVGNWELDFWFAGHSPMTEDVRSCARESFSRSPALSLVSLDLVACEQFQLLPSSLKKLQRMIVLCPWFAGQA